MRVFFAFLVDYPVMIGTLLAVLFGVARFIVAPEDRKRCDWLIVGSLLALPAGVFCEGTTKLLSGLVPLKFDQYILHIDGLLGFYPSFMMGQFVVRHFWLEVASGMAYSSLPCAIVAIFAAYLWRRPEEETLRVLRTFILNLFLAVPIYSLIPVCGPKYAFLGFPFVAPLHFIPHMVALAAPPNGIPSVHMSTALLILWFAWRWKLGRALGVLYLALIAISTLGSGEHYLFDLFAAVPYSVLIGWLGTIEWRRARAVNAHEPPPQGAGGAILIENP